MGDLIPILQLLAVIAIIITAFAVMTGAIEPSDAFRRLGTALVLLVVIPEMMTTLIATAVAPLLTTLVTVLVKAASILAIVGAISFVVWVVLRIIGVRWPHKHNNIGEE